MADAKDSIDATSRLFWIYQGIALAASLLAFLPDRSSTYTDAIAELRRLEAIHIGVNDVDAALSNPAYAAIGQQIIGAISQASAAERIKLSKGMLANSSYFFVDSGPEILDFGKTRVADIIDAIDAYEANPTYAIMVPQPSALEAALRSKLVGEYGVITSFSIPCNYAPDRCSADVYVNPNGDDAVGAQSDLQFYVPRMRVQLPFGVRDLVARSYPAFKNSWLSIPAIRRVEDDIAELPPSAAIAKLQDLRKNEDRPISVFDVSFSGATARLTAPVLLALLAFATWASASGLAKLNIAQDVIESSLFLPLIETQPATAVRLVLFFFPIAVSDGLLVRSWHAGLADWSAALAAVLVQCCATLAMFSIFAHLRAPKISPARLRRGKMIAAAAMALSVAFAISWSLSATSKAASDSALPSNSVQASRPSNTSHQSPPHAETEATEKAIEDIRRKEGDPGEGESQ